MFLLLGRVSRVDAPGVAGVRAPDEGCAAYGPLEGPEFAANVHEGDGQGDADEAEEHEAESGECQRAGHVDGHHFHGVCRRTVYARLACPGRASSTRAAIATSATSGAMAKNGVTSIGTTVAIGPVRAW